MKIRKKEQIFRQIQVIFLKKFFIFLHISYTASVLHSIESRWNDINEKTIVDLGCGCGVLSIGAVVLGCNYCLSIDIDQDALEVCETNINDMEIDNVDLLQMDVLKIVENDRFHKKFDTVVTNPPFGTKNNAGIDMEFLKAAMWMSNSAIYSFHKTSTRKHILSKMIESGYSSEVIAQLRFDIPQTYKFHKQKSVDIEVDVFRFVPNPSK